MVTPTSVLTQAVLNGTYDSSSVAVPTGINPSTGNPWQFILLAATMSSTDGLDTTKKAITKILVSYDGVNYVLAFVGEWLGGAQNRNGSYGPNVGISIPVGPDGVSLPVRAMLQIDTEGNSLNTGLTLGYK
jgi:hypothetical protein